MMKKSIFLSLCFVLSSCGGTLPELDVEEQWTAAMRQQSLYAIFPITEDVFVGDVLLDTREVSRTDNDAFQVIRLARTDPDLVLDQLCNDRERRIVIASRQSVEEAKKKDVDTNQAKYIKCPPRRGGSGWNKDKRFPPGYSPSGRLIGHSDSDADIRLSKSDIPEATVARLTAAQLGASGIFSNLAANLGFASTSRVAMTIKLEDLESLEIPARAILPILEVGTKRSSAIDPATVVAVVAQKWPEGAVHLCKGEFSKMTDRARIAIVTRVEYASQITYEFTDSSEQALSAALDLSGLVAGGTAPTSIPTINSTGAQSITINGTPDQSTQSLTGDARTNLANAENTAAKRLSALLGAVTGGPTETTGVTGSIGIGSTGNLRLNATYKQPMAVGAGAKLVFPVETALLGQRNHIRVTDALNMCASMFNLKRLDENKHVCHQPLVGDYAQFAGFKERLCKA